MKIIVCYKHAKTITYIIYKSNHFHHIETLDLILAGILGCCHFSNILPIHPSHQVVAKVLWYIHPCFRDHPLHSDSFHLPSIFSWLRSLFDRPGETKHDLGGVRRLAVFHCTNGAIEGLILNKKTHFKNWLSRFLLESTIKHSLKAHLYSSEFVLNPPL